MYIFDIHSKYKDVTISTITSASLLPLTVLGMSLLDINVNELVPGGLAQISYQHSRLIEFELNYQSNQSRGSCCSIGTLLKGIPVERQEECLQEHFQRVRQKKEEDCDPKNQILTITITDELGIEQYFSLVDKLSTNDDEIEGIIGESISGIEEKVSFAVIQYGKSKKYNVYSQELIDYCKERENICIEYWYDYFRGMDRPSVNTQLRIIDEEDITDGDLKYVQSTFTYSNRGRIAKFSIDIPFDYFQINFLKILEVFKEHHLS